MPLFSISRKALSTVDQTNFSAEKDLQALIEKNLQTVFGCRFVASEFPTGATHAGRIDTLALSEDNNPVIVEYKKVESSVSLIRAFSICRGSGITSETSQSPPKKSWALTLLLMHRTFESFALLRTTRNTISMQFK